MIGHTVDFLRLRDGKTVIGERFGFLLKELELEQTETNLRSDTTSSLTSLGTGAGGLGNGKRRITRMVFGSIVVGKSITFSPLHCFSCSAELSVYYEPGAEKKDPVYQFNLQPHRGLLYKITLNDALS